MDPSPPADEAGVAARGSDRRRSQTIVYMPSAKRQIPPLDDGEEIPPFGLSPASVTVMSNRGRDSGQVGLGTPAPRLRRRGHAWGGMKTLVAASAIGATVAGCIAVEIWMLVEDSDVPGLPPKQASLPQWPKTLPPELRAVMTASEAERIARVASGQPGISLPPIAPTERRPAESTIEAPLRQTGVGSEYEKIVGVDNTAAMREPPRLAIPQLDPISRPEPPAMARLDPAPIATLESTPIERAEPVERVGPAPLTTAQSTPIARAEPTPTTTPEPHSIATAESTWIERLGPPLESPHINHAAPHIAKAADRAGFLFADSNVRYLTRAELQKLSADQLHIARNEIFARRGRFFKDDGLRAYFSQFPWYRPRAWEIPLGPVETANVALIQSAEQDNVGLAQSSEAPVAASRGIAGPLAASTKAESDVPFTDPSRRYLTPEQLQGLSADQLAVVRNEIFARKGRYFKDDWLRAYFSQFPWYQPYAWDVPLTPIDQANVKLVQSLEQTAATSRPALRPWRVPPM
jgi:YARHG domain